VEAIADKGVERALADDPSLRLGVNVAAGKVTYQPVADAVGLPFTPVDEVLAGAAAG
jgi:alanine dehydrogenase